MIEPKKGSPVFIVLAPDEPRAPEYCGSRFRDKDAAFRAAASIPGSEVWKYSVDKTLGKYEGTAFRLSCIYKEGET